MADRWPSYTPAFGLTLVDRLKAPMSADFATTLARRIGGWPGGRGER